MDTDLYRRFYELEEHFWWSVGTRRIFMELVRGLVDQRGRVIDVGCGTGMMLREFPYPSALLCGCDASPIALAFSQQRGLRRLVRSDAAVLPFTSNAFDLVMALDVIEHLDDDAAAMREIVRVCRPGGHVLVHVPAFPILWTDKDDLNQHRRRYRRGELHELMRSTGLQVREIAYINCALFPAALLRAGAQRLRRPNGQPAPTADAVDAVYRIPAALNRLLLGLMLAEFPLRRLLPFGMSLVCLAEKPAMQPAVVTYGAPAPVAAAHAARSPA